MLTARSHECYNANSLTVNSKLVNECMTSLVIASCYFYIKLVSVLGHSGLIENGKAGELARKGTITQISSGWKHFRAFGQCAIDLTLEEATCKSWNEDDEVVKSKHFHLHCPAFVRLRLEHLCCHSFSNPTNWLELVLAVWTLYDDLF